MVEREKHLDGLRGIAAAVVCVFHFLRAFEPQFLSADTPLQKSPLSSIWNGPFAVQVFFALSGFLFFGKFYRSSFSEAVAACVKRYARLTLPVLCVSLLAWVIHGSGLFCNQPAAALTNSDWLAKWYLFKPSFSLAISEPLVGMYAGIDPALTYNSNLWTIWYELFGVWMVIAAAAACRHLPRRAHLAPLIAAALVVQSSYAFSFVLGGLIAYAGIACSRREIGCWPLAAIVFGLQFGSFHSAIAFPMWFTVTWEWAVGASLLIAAVEHSKLLRRLLSKRLPVFLGRISFGVYLIHFLMVNSVASTAYLSSGSALLSFVAYSVSVVLLAWLFEILVDTPYLRTINRAVSLAKQKFLEGKLRRQSLPSL